MKKVLLITCFSILPCFLFGRWNRSSSVHIHLLPPEGYSTLPYEEMEVTLTQQRSGNGVSLHYSSTGQALFSVEPGYYAASVHYQAASGLVFSGRIESLSLLSDQD